MNAQLKRRPERFALRVVKGGFNVADITTAERLRNRSYRVGDLVFAEFKKPRNPKFHALAHQLGALCVENLEPFSGMKPHAVLKRLQIESGVGCEEIALRFPGIGPCVYRTPISMSFESMDDGEFKDVMRGLCRHIASEYWPGVDPQAIENMAGCMIQETP